MIQVKIATKPEDINKCRRAVQALRPLLTDALFPEAMTKTLADNRQLIYVEDDHEACAIAIFETGYNLFRGKYIYIDDLSTLPESRGKGYAGLLLDWIFEYARQEKFDQVHLDSGVNDARNDAHRLYLNKRFQIASLHFVAKV